MRTLIAAIAAFLLASPVSAAVVAGGNGAGPGVVNNNPDPNGNNNNNVKEVVSVVGQAYEVAISDGTKTTLNRLTFKTKDLSCDLFDKWGITSVPYTEQAGRGKSVTFKGELKDASGNGIVISGTATGESISGTIEVTKKGDTQSYDFKGGKPGSEEAKAARAEVEKAKKAEKDAKAKKP